MSYVKAAPELLEAASADLAGIGSTLSSANASAAAPTTTVPAAGSDDVSAAISALFNVHAQAYQRLSAQAGAFHDQFVQLLRAGARSYATVDAANEAALQSGPAFGAATTAGTAALTPTPVAATAGQAVPEATPIYAALANSPAFQGMLGWPA